MIILKTELLKILLKKMQKTKFLQLRTLFHTMVKHLNTLKSMIFQIALNQLADGHLGKIDISGRLRRLLMMLIIASSSGL